MSIVNFILIGTIITLILLIGFIGFGAYQQKRYIQIKDELSRLGKNQEEKLAVAVIESQEKDRKRMSEELHDGISPYLLSAIRALNLNLQESKDELQTNRILKIKEDVETSMHMLKNVAYILHPADLENSGLLLILQDFCVFMEHSMDCRVEVHTNLEEVGMDPMKQLILYRIVQELIVNAIKHGNASSFKISIFEKMNEFNLIIFHNGSLFLKKDYIKGLQNAKGLGLKNIQQRLNLLNAEIIFYSNNDLTEQSIQIIFPIS